MNKKLLTVQKSAENVGYNTELCEYHIHIKLDGVYMFTYDANHNVLFSYSTQHLKDLNSGKPWHYIKCCFENNIQNPPILPEKILRYASKAKGFRYIIKPIENAFAIYDTHTGTHETETLVSRAANIALGLNIEWSKFIKYNEQHETWE